MSRVRVDIRPNGDELEVFFSGQRYYSQPIRDWVEETVDWWGHWHEINDKAHAAKMEALDRAIREYVGEDEWAVAVLAKLA